MTISLVKGQKIDLTKGNAGLSKITVGLGWDPADSGGKGLFGFKKKAANIDCDASVLLLNEQGKLKGGRNVVCFHNLQNDNGSVVHGGDNLTGAGDGDDEQIHVDLSAVPPDIHRILAVVNIYDCEARKQHFGMIQSAFIRIFESGSGRELARFNLTDDYSGMTALLAGEIYRQGGEWKFSAIGEGAQAPHIDLLARRYA
ncbi:TerD family protein [Saccharibacillus sp. CPCC 101409]|uniref:TerD family protein n=1 Tax=Saccharibacillus sp. CPCC 101409 TaxID=3058041 RepID=UPI0026731FC4|nr:TerD family protein [Saccharibacillus sp. CPCC 101409]MDO3408518.1 TerD family protein [Saccharibacillus sp. CPCC 101409]